MLRRWLATLARAAAARGQVSAAGELWRAAGCWAEALALAALQGDLDALRQAATVPTPTNPSSRCATAGLILLALAALQGGLDALRQAAARVPIS